MMNNHPDLGKWHIIQYGMVLVSPTSWKWKRQGNGNAMEPLRASQHCLKPFQTPSNLILWLVNVDTPNPVKKYRAKYDVASKSQVEENVRNVRSVAIMCTWFKEKSANIVTVGNPKIHLYFVLKEFVPVMVSLVTVHNYVTFNKDTFLYLVLLMLLFCTYWYCMYVVFMCSLLLFYFLAYLLSKLCPFKSLGKVSSRW